MANYLFSSYNALSKIFKEGAYVSDAVYKEIEGDENADIIYRIVMGVLEKNNELDFKLSKLVDKRPKSAICIVLKQGIYCLDYMDSLPDYAVVNNSVDLAKTINKGAYKGFVNAVLKRAATEKNKSARRRRRIRAFDKVRLSRMGDKQDLFGIRAGKRQRDCRGTKTRRHPRENERAYLFGRKV